MLSNETIKELGQKNKLPEVVVEFIPSPNFKEEFLEFIKEVLSWDENKNLNLKKNENS